MADRGEELWAVASTRDACTVHLAYGDASESVTQSGINKRVSTGHRKLDLERALTRDPHPPVAAAPSPSDSMA
jgi:hypothetical protein